MKLSIGYKKILEAQKTDTSAPLLIQTENQKSCISSKQHRYKIDEKTISFAYAKDLKIGDYILCRGGREKIVNIQKFKKAIDLYDIEVDEVHQYYTNDIISHNSSYAVDSIIFALFGRTLKNTNNKYIPNRYCDSKLKSYVKLYFSVDGQRYTSECYCKPKIGTVGMELKRWSSEINDWEDITQASVIKTRQYIQDNILRMFI